METNTHKEQLRAFKQKLETKLGDLAALDGFDEIPVLDLVADEADAENLTLDSEAVCDLALRYFAPQD